MRTTFRGPNLPHHVAVADMVSTTRRLYRSPLEGVGGLTLLGTSIPSTYPATSGKPTSRFASWSRSRC